MPKRDIFRLAYTVNMLAGSSDTAEVMLYGEIVQDGPEWWKWSKEDKSAADFDKAIKEVQKNGATKLLVRINSPGGVCSESVAMRTILAAAQFEEITVRIEGLCASAATNIATLPGAHVQIGEGSEYMIHNPSGGCYGFAEDMERYAARLRNLEKTTRGFYASKTGQSDDQIKTWMDAETWFTAEEAVEYGFADELLKAEAENEVPAAACVSSRAMAVMHGLYKAVPEQVAVRDEEEPEDDGHEEEPAEGAGDEEVSNGASVAGEPTENNSTEEENRNMEMSNLTSDQLQAENPALFDQIRQQAIETERQRLEEIDALTLPGCETMAAEAKKNGTSALDFQKQVVAAQKAKGAAFLANRQKETEPAEDVAPGAAGDGKTEEQEIADNAKDIAEYAKMYAGGNNATMF